MKKKLISFCLVLATVLSMLVMPVSADSSLKASDVTKEAGLLQAVGIISAVPDETEGNREITRAEFVVTVAKAMGVKATNENVKYFSDIPSDHWSLPYINRLVEMGIISLPDDRLYRPNDKITINEAIKILICTLGYGEYALMLGSYPAGYSEAARKLEFSVTGGNETLTVYKSYIMLYDALKAPMYKKTAAGGGYVSYDESNETLLSKYFDVYEAEGIITQSAGISIYGDVITGATNQDTANIVAIDGERYISNIDLYDYLGRRTVVYYVQEDKDDDKNIIYREDYKRNDQPIDIKSDDLSGYSNGVLKYYDEKGRIEKLNIPVGTIVVKNGEIVSKNTAQAFDIKKGDIRVIDIEDDGVYDVVLISEYKNYVVDRISPDSYVIYDKVDSSNSVTLDENKKIVFIKDANGTKKAFSDIKSGNVISVYESDSYVKAVIGPDSVSANLYSVKTEDDKFMLQLGKSESDKNWYEVDESYYNKYILGKYYTNSNGEVIYTGDIDLSPGGTITYYKDVAGNIAYLTGPTPSGWTAAYLVKLTHNEDDDKAIVKAFTQNGEMVKLQTSDKLKVDGELKRGYTAIAQALDKNSYGKTLSNGEHNINGQVIRFKTNADKEITEIDTEKVNAAEGRLSLHRTQNVASLTWWYHTSCFYANNKTQLFFTGQTIKFGVPTHSELENAQDDDFSIMSTYTDTSAHVMEGFKLDKKGANEDILVEYGAGNSATKGPFLVDRVYKTASTDGEIIVQADVYNIESCDKIKLSAKDGFEFTHSVNNVKNNIERGDIILVNVDSKGRVTNATVYYDYSRRNDPSYEPQKGWVIGNGTWQNDSVSYLLAAYLKSFDDGLLRFKYSSKITAEDLNEDNYTSYDWATKNDAKSTLVYDGRNITVGTEADIVPATITGVDEAPLYWFTTRYARVKGAVIYK